MHLPLSQAFCLSIWVHVCVWIHLSTPFNLSPRLCLAPLSLPIVSIFLLSQTTYPSIYFESTLLPSGLTTIFPISMALTYLDIFLLRASHLFLALSYHLVSEASFSLSLFLLCLSTFSLRSWISCSTILLFRPPSLSLSHICLAHLFLAFSYQLVSVAFLSLSFSMLHICLSIPCRYNSFLASNLFMFSLVLL